VARAVRTLPYTEGMSLRTLPYLAASLPFLSLLSFLFALAACSDAPSDDGVGGLESNYTSEGGADASAAETAPTAPARPVDVPAFTLADTNGTTAKLRFSYDGSAPVDAIQAEWTTVVSGTDRRFQLQGGTPGAAGGRPVFYAEFGRGAAIIEKSTYDCASNQAVVLVIDESEKKNLTVVQGGAQRACKVVIDDLKVVQPTTSPRAKPFYEVIGHVEAEVGPREDASAPTKSVRATFAATVFESAI
jgi:hypothetical protein